MTILTAVLFLKRRLLKIAKPPVLRTCGNDNSKSRYQIHLRLSVKCENNYNLNAQLIPQENNYYFCYFQ